jgi:hypothetical protein
MDVKEIGWESMVWIDLAQYRDQALVNMIIKVWISLTQGISLLVHRKYQACQAGLCSL